MILCFECGGVLTEKTVDLEETWEGGDFVITDVPVRICTQCQEKYFDIPVLSKIEEMMKSEAGIQRETILHFKVA